MAAQNTDLVDQLPLQGVVLCCTSLAQDVRTKLADAAGQMGAVHKLDLTSDVTHLLVANVSTPKYRYVAKERPDIKVLSPDFVEAVRVAWTEGGNVDVERLEKEHTLPPFLGLQVCLTGIPDQPRRSNMEHGITNNGGTYHGDLTKVVTHLIVAKPEGAKYTFAKQWNIPVVSVKWFEDSLARGMALQEDLYAPELPLEQQGKNAFRKVAKRPSLGKRPRDGEQGVGNADSSRRKLRKTASMRFDSQSQDMWQSISAQEVQVEATELDAWNDESQTLRKSERPQSKGQSANSRPVTPMAPVEPSGIFSGHFILIHGFNDDRTKRLRRYLEPNGATVVNSPEELEKAGESVGFQVRCLMMPHATPTKLPDVPPGTELVTEWWVERCLLYKQKLDPVEDLLSSPLSDAVVSGFANLTISLTGFDSGGVLYRQTAESIELMGATLDQLFLPSTSVLVCISGTVKKEKAFYAWKHSIPVVSANWLWDSLKSRRRAPFDKYKIDLPAFDAADVYADPSASSTPAPSEEKSQLPIRGSENAKRAADLLPPKRLSNTRRRHATASLPLQASKPSEHKKPRPGPFIWEDDDNNDEPMICDEQVAPVAETTSHLPLREISPNKSQPRGSRNLDADNPKDDTADKVVTEDQAASPRKEATSPPRSPIKEGGEKKPKLREDLTSDLASILARQVASRPETLEPQKRKHRPLGRNLSTTSNPSGSTSASPNLPSEIPESVFSGDGFDAAKEVSSMPPSTQLGYDTPEAEAHRKKLSKQMGTSFNDDVNLGRRVCSVGTVKDSAEIASRTAVAAASRAKARRGKT